MINGTCSAKGCNGVFISILCHGYAIKIPFNQKTNLCVMKCFLCHIKAKNKFALLKPISLFAVVILGSLVARPKNSAAKAAILPLCIFDGKNNTFFEGRKEGGFALNDKVMLNELF